MAILLPVLVYDVLLSSANKTICSSLTWTDTSVAHVAISLASTSPVHYPQQGNIFVIPQMLAEQSEGNELTSSESAETSAFIELNQLLRS